MGDFWLPEAASTMAPKIDSLFTFVNVVSGILLVGVVTAMLWFMYRYRRQDPAERPSPVKESKLLEISWIVIPTILVLLVFNWGFKSFVAQKTIPDNAYEIRVQARSWGWSFEYPNGVTTDTLYVPADEPVKTTMSSQDVIHSFYVPAFRVKQDVLPNRYTSVWFEATKEGTYDLFCTEYCGRNHSEMDAEVKVVSRARFDEWLESAGTPDDIPLPELGEKLYTQQGCQGCHSLDGSDMVGPTWKGLYGKTDHQMADGSTVTADANYLRESILQSGAKVVEGYQNVMPSYASLSEREVTGLVEFIKEQSDKEVSEE
ncbi:cytochrome c oxidase subunit 2 [Salinibacter ruber]|jgi:cytochrome c oxidase subunit 2|uniref:Cytochrome c oxidase subunit 2 n=3 Tax=Salinibacter ruber TaxID=146919 RepID=Q2S0S5_SALRD|nr:cytochrome c oxidase subunit II [Salinibacter ruber]ABC44510.1 cytochrome oxidase subunit II [Salinibacter ruber DSM 13855]MCS3633053.1 cytochrome c oxidase subunit 2 [Salinibacter ruber]MCS3644869.1 cytochrome c oxidase subunit 2 [Salinibacter ruber]MCS3664772.1 cytochrome c oxidase subunit 2 [Salinibacter ruber]MCS3701276.1 cytochrome c oxidase subunit 2 [Salinibacter ruber]